MELYIDVLRAINNGRKSPSKIVNYANLSYDRVIKCVNFLEEKTLVKSIDNTRKRYAVTDKGKEVLYYFENIKRNMMLPSKEMPYQYNRNTPLLVKL